MPCPSFFSLRVVAAFSLLSIGAAAFAAKHVEQSAPVRLGMAHVPPVYQAGVKFRTPEKIDMTLAQAVAKEVGASLKPMRVEPAKGEQLLVTRKLDALIASFSSSGISNPGTIAIPTGYAARPMAIMRTDTTIKAPDQLRGRKVCLSEGGAYVGWLAEKYGAIESVTKAPADSLLAVRTGACDAAVHDSALLEELIKLPEWKKFSASMILGPVAEHAVIVRRADETTLNAVKKTVGEWRRTDFIPQEIKRMVRHIAFEVYLDQNVPDCH